jgi:hypothetical protein
LGNASDLSQGFAPEAFADLGEGGTLGIAQPQSRWQLRPQNAVLRSQIFVLQQKLLVHRACHISQKSHPSVVLHADRLSYSRDGQF